MGQFGYAAIQPDNRFYIFFFLIDVYDFSFGAFRLNVPIHVLDVSVQSMHPFFIVADS